MSHLRLNRLLTIAQHRQSRAFIMSLSTKAEHVIVTGLRQIGTFVDKSSRKSGAFGDVST